MNSWRSTTLWHQSCILVLQCKSESDIDQHREDSEMIWKPVSEITCDITIAGRQTGKTNRQLSSLCLMIEMQPAFCHDLCALPVCKLQSTFCSYSLVSKDQLPSFWVSCRLILQNKWNCIVCTHFYFVEMNICAPIFPRRWVLGDMRHEHNTISSIQNARMHSMLACTHRSMNTTLFSLSLTHTHTKHIHMQLFSMNIRYSPLINQHTKKRISIK